MYAPAVCRDEITRGRFRVRCARKVLVFADFKEKRTGKESHKGFLVDTAAAYKAAERKRHLRKKHVILLKKLGDKEIMLIFAP